MILAHMPDGYLHPAPSRLKGVVIFGTTQLASITWYCIEQEGDLPVVGFTADRSHLATDTLHGLPTVAFERLRDVFPPDEYCLHLAIGWRGMNGLRASKLAQARQLGYAVYSHVAQQAQTYPDLVTGVHCALSRGTFIGPFSSVGDNVLMFGRTNIGHHVAIESDCFVAGGAQVCGGAVIGRGSVLGAGCIVLDGVRVAPRTFIGAGSLVNRDTEENGVYVGSPARKRSRITAEAVSLRN